MSDRTDLLFIIVISILIVVLCFAIIILIRKRRQKKRKILNGIDRAVDTTRKYIQGQKISSEDVWWFQSPNRKILMPKVAEIVGLDAKMLAKTLDDNQMTVQYKARA